MPSPASPSQLRLALATAVAGILLIAILAGVVFRFRSGERAVIHRTIIERDATVLYPEALQLAAEAESALADTASDPADILIPVLRSARQEGMLAAVAFDLRGDPIQAVPSTLLLPELAPEDYPVLLGGQTISRYHPAFALDQAFSQLSGPPSARTIPVLEVLLPVHGRDGSRTLGFVQYLIDGHKLAEQLASVDRQLDREAAGTLAAGSALIALVLAGAFLALGRANRAIAERNQRLKQANFELTLAAKASALGQVASHLIHGLQGPVAGLRAVVSSRPADERAADWASAADYAERLQGMIHETVALLRDIETRVAYELDGRDLADMIRRRSLPAAADKGVLLEIGGNFDGRLDNHRGSLVCLIASNLIDNAVAATAPGRRVEARLDGSPGTLALTVADQGTGIPPEIRARLFEPGRSGRPGGTGLGLAISHLLALQIGATLALDKSGPDGTTFRLALPLGAAP